LSFGGAVFPVRDSGPYTVNSDCTASATYSDGAWKMVIVGHGKEIKAMNTAPGTAVQAVLTRQSIFERLSGSCSLLGTKTALPCPRGLHVFPPERSPTMLRVSFFRTIQSS
jgi:hypothetical protein